MTTDSRREGLHEAIIEDFVAHWAIGGVLVYASASGENPGAIDADLLADLAIAADAYERLPDVILHDPLKNRLFLVESVTNHGHVSEQRRAELARLFSGAKVDLVFVTASPSRSMMAQYVLDVAWETTVWAADEPAHLIHFVRIPNAVTQRTFAETDVGENNVPSEDAQDMFARLGI